MLTTIALYGTKQRKVVALAEDEEGVSLLFPPLHFATRRRRQRLMGPCPRRLKKSVISSAEFRVSPVFSLFVNSAATIAGRKNEQTAIQKWKRPRSGLW